MVQVGVSEWKGGGGIYDGFHNWRGEGGKEFNGLKGEGGIQWFQQWFPWFEKEECKVLMV